MGNTTATVTTRASEAAKWFTTTKRGDDTITVLKEGRPDWVQALAFAGHDKGDMLPDDWRYECIKDAVNAIAEADDLDEAASEFENDVDVYTSDLTGWLHSRTDRYAYVDEAREEYGADLKSVTDELALGQGKERREVFDLVREYLENLEDDDETTETA